jgi:hypothetical protein
MVSERIWLELGHNLPEDVRTALKVIPTDGKRVDMGKYNATGTTLAFV